MSASVWVCELITFAAFVTFLLSWGLAYQTGRGPTRWTWLVTGCFPVALAIQVGYWRGG